MLPRAEHSHVMMKVSTVFGVASQTVCHSGTFHILHRSTTHSCWPCAAHSHDSKSYASKSSHKKSCCPWPVVDLSCLRSHDAHFLARYLQFRLLASGQRVAASSRSLYLCSHCRRLFKSTGGLLDGHMSRTWGQTVLSRYSCRSINCLADLFRFY